MLGFARNVMYEVRQICSNTLQMPNYSRIAYGDSLFLSGFASP